MNSKPSISGKMIWRAIASPVSWLPVLAGGVVAASTISSGFLFWGGLAAVAVGAGSVIWKMTGGSRQNREQVLQELQKESNRDHYEYLRRLQRKLRKDKDPLTGKMLRELRETHKRMDQMGILAGYQTPLWKAEVKEKVVGLYESSVKSLENTFDVWTKAQQVKSNETRETLLGARSKILAEVVSSVEQLGKTLDHLQVSEVESELPDENLAELRQELDRGLEVAKNIEARISELDEKIRVATKSPVN